MEGDLTGAGRPAGTPSDRRAYLVRGLRWGLVTAVVVAIGFTLLGWSGLDTPAGDGRGCLTAFSPGGTFLAVVDRGGKGQVRDLAAGRVAVTFSIPVPKVSSGSLACSTDGLGGIDASAFSVVLGPDGRSIVTGLPYDSANSLAPAGLRNAATGRTVAALSVAQPDGTVLPPDATAFSADGRTLAGSTDDGQLYLWDTATGRRTTTFTPLVPYDPNSPDPLDAVALSPDGSTVATGSRLGRLGIWDVRTGKNTVNLLPDASAGDPQPITTVAFSPDGRTVASGGSTGVVRLWDVATGRNTLTLPVSGLGNSGDNVVPLRTVLFSPDGRSLVTLGQGDDTIGRWDVATGSRTATYTGGPADGGVVSGLAFTAQGRLEVASIDGTAVHVWTAG
ncbi:WD40 repeat domain-containing protein [Kitasatospora viridis]|uniref:WD domain G-beta repeat uncharacterized protein n=1 Tax=Kitasatospora viridis TaxID=281105 RepID=A0A561UP31_9ACTN|nr:PD40 domain-containing protein [Kitasatospora viridis]TWG01109.1 WD domain G-beta repeat uncharacterized protein [Kitasatospora viridis]